MSELFKSTQHQIDSLLHFRGHEGGVIGGRANSHRSYSTITSLITTKPYTVVVRGDQAGRSSYEASL